jgi:pyruvate-formate lyase
MKAKEQTANSTTARVKADKERIDRLKEQLRSTTPEVDFERIRIMEEVYAATQGDPNIMRRAKFMAALLQRKKTLHRRQPLRRQHGQHRQWNLHVPGMERGLDEGRQYR